MNVVREKKSGNQLLLRFPEAGNLRERLSQIAERNNRSLTAEIINRLESSLDAGSSNPALAPSNSEERLVSVEDAVANILGQLMSIEDRLAALGTKIPKWQTLRKLP